MAGQNNSFHLYYDAGVNSLAVHDAAEGWKFGQKKVNIRERSLAYQVAIHDHPYVPELTKRLIRESIPGLLAADTDYVTKADGSYEPLTNDDGSVKKRANGAPIAKPVVYSPLLTPASYSPSSLISHPYPVNDLDFTTGGAYSVYNWELFYHIPLAIGLQLCQNQRYEESLKWLRYIFDPGDDSSGPTPDRFWKLRPFQSTDVRLIEDILVNLSTNTDPALRQQTIDQIGLWKNAPFRPFVVARSRPTAFMFKAVTATLDTLIAWGDSLFATDSGEAINEATQLYIMAANILGQKPQSIGKKGSVRPSTYTELRGKLDDFSNALVDLEPEIPFDDAPLPSQVNASEQTASIGSVGQALYFCIPRNRKLIAYWDTVADRLFKIRNSLNLQGVFRQLPLFDPPLDPALLARAAAAGLDISAVVAGINQPLPLVRFELLKQRALDVCQHVMALGAGLLAAIEKQDFEALQLLRAKHETTILQLAEMVKYSTWQESIKTREAIAQTIANVGDKYRYYQRLLGLEASDIDIPTLEDLDRDGLDALKFSSVEPGVDFEDIPIEIAQDPSGLGGGHLLTSDETSELDNLDSAHTSQNQATGFQKTGSTLAVIPMFGARFEPLGCGGTISFGGANLASAMTMFAEIHKTSADNSTFSATVSNRMAGYSRREQEWRLLRNVAAGELTQAFKQLRAAQIREAMTEREWKNHQTQIKNAQQIEEFLTDETKGKTTNKAFYGWLRGEMKRVYTQCFNFAFDVAKKAERAIQQELGEPQLTFLHYGYLSGKQGLLAAEKLYFDLRRMELAYAELNRREYELSKNVSLLQLDPIALLQLRTTGSCTITLPESLFDMDGPGHYFRRIKAIGVSLPCVAGPYTSVSCRLTLRRSTIRRSPLVGDGYARQGADDDRFSDFLGSVQSIVTSSAQNDFGLFEINLRDDRKLPFEYAGVISEWQLDLPADVRQFDYQSIADVILQIRYWAREGGDLLRKAAVTDLEAAIAEATASGSIRLFSIRHEFPNEWAKFKAVSLTGGTTRAPLTIGLGPQHYPFWSGGRLKALRRVEFFANTTKNSVQISSTAADGGLTDAMVKDPALLDLRSGALQLIPAPAPTGSFTLFFDDNTMSDLWMAVSWGSPIE